MAGKKVTLEIDPIAKQLDCRKEGGGSIMRALKDLLGFICFGIVMVAVIVGIPLSLLAAKIFELVLTISLRPFAIWAGIRLQIT